MEHPKATEFVFTLTPSLIQHAAHTLQQGGVIAYPTEAVWGLGCDPTNPDAIKRLLTLKQRPVEKGLILIGATTTQFEPILAHLTQAEREQLMATWPGPVTWVVPHFGLVSGLVSGGRDTVALRVSDHPLVQTLCLAFGGPIVSTSANPAGHEEARSALTVHNYFADQLDDVLDGELGGLDRPTQIRELKSGKQLRSS